VWRPDRHHRTTRTRRGLAIFGPGGTDAVAAYGGGAASAVETDFLARRLDACFVPDTGGSRVGRIFETRKATMFARWNKMAKAFTRISKDIAIAVKAGGPNPDGNSALRRAIQNARAANMPKDKIESAIKRASGQGGAAYEVVLYEGYAPHGIAVMVETATDNTVRTVANVRMHFKDYGGSMGTTGSVGFLFQRMGVFRLDPAGLDLEALELDLIDHGLEDMGEGKGEKGERQIVARCGFADFGRLQAGIEARGLSPLSAVLEYVPNDVVELDEAQATAVLELVDALEQDDDVQHVFHNLG
jgi:YebC/PmpR family DNA-binding regulatory protein